MKGTGQRGKASCRLRSFEANRTEHKNINLPPANEERVATLLDAFNVGRGELPNLDKNNLISDCRNGANAAGKRKPLILAEHPAKLPLKVKLDAPSSEPTSSRSEKPVAMKIPVVGCAKNEHSEQLNSTSEFADEIGVRPTMPVKSFSRGNTNRKSHKAVTKEINGLEIACSMTAKIRQNPNHAVVVQVDSECGDKATAAMKIASLSGCNLDESVIENIALDSHGGCAIIVKCATEEQSKALVRAINTRRCNAHASYFVDESEKNLKCSDYSQKQLLKINEAEASLSNLTASSAGSRSHNKKLFIVYLSLQTGMSKEQTEEYVREVSSFPLQHDTIEMDVVMESTVSYGAFVACKTKCQAECLLKHLNELSRKIGNLSVASLLESPIGDVTIDSLHGDLDSLASKQIEAHDAKCKDAEAKLENAKRNLASGKGKFLPLDVFQRNKATVKLLEDKIVELTQQKREFKNHATKLRAKADQILGSRNTKLDLCRIRHEFEREIDQFSSALPIYAYKSDIVSLVQSNQVSIILGETGSGKSTQILQYLLRAIDDGVIVCTQPRKVAAISLASRVSIELCSAVGGLVGYKVGMQIKQSDVTRLLYVTDHVLLNDCLKDPSLDRYSCVVIDEAHERSIFTDLLLCFVKRALLRRADLRLIIMSATINPDLFASYFAECSASNAKPPIMRISGRTFPVDVVYSESSSEDYVKEAALKALDVHREQPSGDILVFLTSPIETEQACKIMRNCCKDDENILPLELHGRLQIDEQQKAFDPAPNGTRKIVFATNCAETSITIPDIKFVIDTGRVREINYDPKKNTSELAVRWVTRSSAEQRKGRAGRTDSGICLRLYSEEQYACMREESVPEILRVHLGQALLKLMTLGINDATHFDFIQAPPADAIASAHAVLKELEACDDSGITEIGKKLSKLTLEPRLGKVVLLGIENDLPFEAVVLAAISSVGGSVFFRAGNGQEKQQADRRKAQFCDEWGDMVTLVNVYREWTSIPVRRNQWCYDNSINARSMRTAESVVKEILHTVKQELGIMIPRRFSCQLDANEKLAKVLFACYSLNLSHFSGHRNGGYCVASEPETVLHVHPSSSLNYLEELPQWVVYEKVLVTSRMFMMNATFVKGSWVAEKLNAGSLPAVNLGQLQEVLVKRHPPKFVGGKCIGSLLNDKAKAVKALEVKIQLRSPKAKAFVEVTKFAYGCGGKVVLYANSVVSKFAADEIASYMTEIRIKNQSESVEQPVVSTNSSRSVRFVLERGAQIRTILMPHETRVVVIKSPNVENVAECDVVSELEKFGEIELVQRKNLPTKDPNIWGFLYFKLPQQAVDVVSLYKPDKHNFSVEVGAFEASKPSHHYENYTVKVLGLRRPIREFGYIKLKDPAEVPKLVARSFKVQRTVNSNMSFSEVVSMKPDVKAFGNMYLTNVPCWADAEIIKAGLLATVGGDMAIESVILPRAVVSSKHESDRLLELFESKIKSLLKEIDCEDCRIELFPVRCEKDFDMRARLTFADPQQASLAASHINFKTVENRNLITASVELKVSFFLSMKIFQACRAWMKDELAILEDEAGSPIRVNDRLNENGLFMSINIFTTDLAAYTLVESRLAPILKGRKLHLEKYQLQNLQSESGKKLLERMERELNVVFRLDAKTRAVFIHGRQSYHCKAYDHLIAEMKSFVTTAHKDIQLSVGGYPKGLMKELVLKFGPNLDGLCLESNATSLELLIRGHIVRFLGSDQAYEIVLASINKVADVIRMRTDQNKVVTEDNDECSVCLTPPDKTEFYVTECCSHIYCRDCIVSLVQSAIRNNEIPIKCAAEACSDALSLQDLRNLLDGSGGLSSVYQSAIQSFMMAHATEFNCCFTPDCPMIFRRAPKDAKGVEVVCSECETSWCSSCLKPYHYGIGCYRNSDDEINTWLSENAVERSRCPKCGVIIEKAEGCQHMYCIICKTHICWRCKMTFQDSDPCYEHLRREHGTIF